jgi:type VI protein secretion system component Hcp
MGALGPQGIIGPEGPQGPKGDPGPAGASAPVPEVLPGAFTLSQDVFMNVDQIPGTSVEARHRNWFDVNGFGLSVRTGEGGARPVWSLGVTVVGLAGTPEFHSHAATGTPIAHVDLDFVRAGGVAISYLKITLEGVIVTSVRDEVSTLPGGSSLDLSFRSIQISAIPLKQDGTAGAAAVGIWDQSSDSGAAPGLASPSPLRVSIDGDGRTNDTLFATAVSPPSQAGGTFGDATLTYTTNNTELVNQLIETAAGTIIPSATIDLFKTGGRAPFLYASYGFTDVRLHSVSISGNVAVSAFNASAFDWTVNNQSATGSIGSSQTAHFP